MNLKQLSDLLGLSQTTVSRALNGYSDVKASTRARVIAAAKEHNYLPNSRAKALATGRAMSIGHVIPAPRGTNWSTRFSQILSRVQVRHTRSAAMTYAW